MSEEKYKKKKKREREWNFSTQLSLSFTSFSSLVRQCTSVIAIWTGTEKWREDGPNKGENGGKVKPSSNGRVNQLLHTKYALGFLVTCREGICVHNFIHSMRKSEWKRREWNVSKSLEAKGDKTTATLHYFVSRNFVSVTKSPYFGDNLLEQGGQSLVTHLPFHLCVH